MQLDSGSQREESEERRLEEVARDSRRGFLNRSAAVTAAVASGLVLGQGTESQAGAPKPAARGYTGVVGSSRSSSGAAAVPTPAATTSTPTFPPSLYPGQNRAFFQEILADENTHVSFLLTGLGGLARPKPAFQNLQAKTIQQFVQMSLAFENLGVQAYLGAAPFLLSADYLGSATRIATVEARHASWLNSLENQPLVPNGYAFDVPLFSPAVVSMASAFLLDLRGGTAPGYDLVRSSANDINILNYALFLEFLEQEFYQINVPTFFP